MAESTADKTHDATPYRRQRAREEGHVARSQELSAAVLLLGGLGALYYLGPALVDYLGGLTARQLGGEPWLAADLGFAVGAWNRVVTGVAGVLLPILGVVVVGGVVGHLMQVGLLFLPGKVVPDFSRLDPLAGLQRMFAMPNAARLVFGLLKLAVAGAVGSYCLASQAAEIIACGQLPLPELALFMCQTLFGAAFKVALALVALALLDYALERWRYERALRMTTAELREEQRQLQGNPQVASRRRSVLRQVQQRDLPIRPVS